MEASVQRSDACSFQAPTGGAFIERALSVSREAPRTERLELAALWHELAAGACRVVESTHSGERCCVTLQRQANGHGRPHSRTSIQILTRVLLGESQKAVALDVGLAQGTIAGLCRDELFAMGGGRLVSRVQTLIAMAAHAACGWRFTSLALTPLEGWRNDQYSVQLARADASLHGVLTSGELDVVRLLLQGCSHHQIAERRASSPRTVANQLAAVFRKLRLSGRAELLSYVIRSCALASP